MKKQQKFFHAKLNRAITLACAGAMGISMTASDRLLAATTLGAGESIAIGSGNSIDVTDDSGVVVSGVVAARSTPPPSLPITPSCRGINMWIS